MTDRTPANTDPTSWTDHERLFFAAGWNDCVNFQPGALGRIRKLCDQCSDPAGWLATNVRHEVDMAQRDDGEQPPANKLTSEG